MLLWHWVQQHRVLSVLVLAGIMAASAGGTAWALIFRTVSSPVSLRQALRLYRREQPTKVAASLRERLPSPGVYAYRTGGAEGLNLIGVQRSFPTTTAMIVTVGRCATVTWIPLLEHTETTVWCRGPSGSLWVPKLTTSETLAGTHATSVVECPTTAWLIPAHESVGMTWSADCTLSGPVERVRFVGRALAGTTMVVSGRPTPVDHVRITLDYAGPQHGTNPTDLWIDPATGLVERESETASITQGGVRYDEHMVARLSTLTPMQ